MFKVFSRMVLLGTVAIGGSHVSAATPDQPLIRDDHSIGDEQFWRVNGGDLTLRFNHDFLDLFGIAVEVAGIRHGPKGPAHGAFKIGASEGLEFNAPAGGFDRFVGGALRVQGQFDLLLGDGTRIDLRDFTLRPNYDNPMRLDVLDADGIAWLYVNHLMYQLSPDSRQFAVRTADLRAGPALAFRVGEPALLDAYIGEVKFDTSVVARSHDWNEDLRCHGGPKFHGTPFPGGGIYQTDVLMEAYSVSFSRCRREDLVTNGCTGGAVDNGEVVFTPGSTLRNNNKDSTADVPWYAKFTLNPYNYPYPGNDQHPYLVWNMYRITDGQLEQIGASGVKHAWLTTNTGCAADACTGGGHILGRNCGDTYGVGNNDAPNDLGPRSELIPATGQWGRCGSIFDINCDGVSNTSGNSSYDQRMVVRESQMLVPASQYFSESWYIVQDDIDIYNTMAHRTMAPAPGGAGWVPGVQGPFQIGPALNSWVNPQSFPNRNVQHVSDNGHVRVAVKVKALDACPANSGLAMPCYRWDYAVNNFDWGHAVTQGTPPNLRVLENKGFSGFSLDMPGSTPTYLEPGVHFADIDINDNNNWTATQGAGSVSWQAPAGNELNWGLLFRFSLVSNRNADDALVGYATLQPHSIDADAPVLQIIVPGANNAPTAGAVIADQSTAEGQQANLPVAANFSDPDGDVLVFSATGLPSNLRISRTTGIISGTLDFGTAGNHPVLVTASDPWGAEATQSFNWTVTTGNLPPVAVGTIADQQDAEGDLLLLDTSLAFSDPDNDALIYAADVLPNGLAIAPLTGVIDGTLAFDAAGNYNVTITATDPVGASAQQAFVWTVDNVNRPPVAVGTIADQASSEGELVNLPIASFFSDADDETLAFSAANLPDGLTIGSTSGVIEGSFGYDAEGNYTVEVTATDEHGATAVQTFGWTIENTNRAPLAVGSVANQVSVQGVSLELDVSGFFDDPDQDVLTFAALDLPGGLSLDADSGVITGSPDSLGSFSVVITANDPEAATATQAFSWEIVEFIIVLFSDGFEGDK